MKLWNLLYRDKHASHTVIIEAEDANQAAKVGVAYCTRYDYMYATVRPFVVAGPEILVVSVAEE